METRPTTRQERYRLKLRREHALRDGMLMAGLRHRWWIWATRLFRLTHGRLGRPMGPSGAA